MNKINFPEECDLQVESQFIGAKIKFFHKETKKELKNYEGCFYFEGLNLVIFYTYLKNDERHFKSLL